jgi:hypothetical protein
VFFSIINLIAPKWVAWLCLGIAALCGVFAAIFQAEHGTTAGFLWWLAGIFSGGAISSRAAGKITDVIHNALEEQRQRDALKPDPPPGHVEGDPLPPVFPPGTEVGPDNSPYDPKAP